MTNNMYAYSKGVFYGINVAFWFTETKV